jgi:hypothetical protein
MLTPAEGRFLTNELPHGSSTPNPDPSLAQRTTVASRPTALRGGRPKKKRNKKCFVANCTSTSSPTFTPTNSLSKRHHFKQQDVPGPSARQAHQGAKHSNLCTAKANCGESKAASNVIGSYLVHSGPTPKRSPKWQTGLKTKKNFNNIHHQAPTGDAISDDYDLLAEADLNIFIMKINALNAHLWTVSMANKTSTIKKSAAKPTKSLVTASFSTTTIAWPDLLLNICCYPTVHEHRLQRAGRPIHRVKSEPCSVITNTLQTLITLAKTLTGKRPTWLKQSQRRPCHTHP